MSSVRIQLTVGSEMSVEFARLDMSKLGDTHAIVMRKELCGAAPPRSNVRRSGRKRTVGECVVTGCLWGVLRSTRRGQGDGGLRNDCLRLFALTRIHDVRCSIVRTFLAP
jgi:hypothetical protein